MICDLVRTACIIATLAVAASLLVETRQRLAAIDLAHRQAVAWQGGYVAQPTTLQASQPEPPGPLARLGRATLGWADAALGILR
jgi:hypothetical protein